MDSEIVENYVDALDLIKSSLKSLNKHDLEMLKEDLADLNVDIDRNIERINSKRNLIEAVVDH
ncbi:MAG: hypothetical protein JKY89_00320 [Immundisolibacteraceae bacterium]|nr:hypothetical protein [Immundisolibacteraceae bacterium]